VDFASSHTGTFSNDRLSYTLLEKKTRMVGPYALSLEDHYEEMHS